jgi:hypothetical protein
MAYATANDVALRLGRELDTSEAQIVSIRLDDAERLIKSRIPDLDGKILDDEIDQGTVVMIEAEAVLRLVRNPQGFTSESDGNYTYMINAAVASGRLEIQDSEWALLGVRRSAFVIAPKVTLPEDCEPHPLTPFCPPFYGHGTEHPAVWWGDESA